MIAFAYKKKHPFYLKYVNSSESEKAELKALIHVSTDYTPNQYWFNLFFAWVIFFTTFWFIGLMAEACIILMRRNSEARIKKYRLEQEKTEREKELKNPPEYKYFYPQVCLYFLIGYLKFFFVIKIRFFLRIQ